MIIFISKNIENLLPTLTSRLQKIHFPSTRNYAEKHAELRGKDCGSMHLDSFVDSDGIRSFGSVSEAEIDQFFENLIGDLKKNPIKNSQRLKEVLRRLVLIKQFNVNKRLQLKTIQQ